MEEKTLIEGQNVLTGTGSKFWYSKSLVQLIGLYSFIVLIVTGFLLPSAILFLLAFSDDPNRLPDSSISSFVGSFTWILWIVVAFFLIAEVALIMMKKWSRVPTIILLITNIFFALLLTVFGIPFIIIDLLSVIYLLSYKGEWKM